MMNNVQSIQALFNANFWLTWAQRGGRAVAVLILGWLLTRIVRRLLRGLQKYAGRAMDRRGEISAADHEKRAKTVATAVSKLASTLIWMVTAVMFLTELNFHIEPLLAGLGVAGLALGLGAQTLIKDWMAGIFLLLEDQIRIGDVVNINGTGGKVEEINLRTTVLRAENGAIHIIPNGSIQSLANMTREYSYYLFEVTLAHHADVAQAMRIIEEAGAELAEQPDFKPLVLAPIEVYGVDRLTDRGLLIRARVKTLPAHQHGIGRALNRLVKERLDAAGIEFPRQPV